MTRHAVIIASLVALSFAAEHARADDMASKCKFICERGSTVPITSQEDKNQYFTCFLAGHCLASACTEPSGSKRVCNPVATMPPSGSPLDIIQRSLGSSSAGVRS